MSNKFLNIITVSIVLSTIAVPVVAKITNITYPVSELGNCGSQEACSDFCDKETNRVACISWAESKGLITSQKAVKMKDMDRMRQYAEGENVDPVYGPGNCQTPEECDAYCRQEDHLDECMQYSVDNGYIDQEEADRIKEKRDMGGPGGCKNEEECRDFCGNPDNIEECMDFIVKEGKITREEADFMIKQARMNQKPMDRRPDGVDDDFMDDDDMAHDVQINEDKVLQILKQEEGPGGCKTIQECDTYCEQDDNAEECMAFVKKHELTSQENIERAEKMMNMTGPGGCKGRKECDAYCEQEEHMEECFNFAKENNLMPPEEIKRAEKEMEIKKQIDIEGGPGGCKSPEECDAYCKQEEHRKECMDFSVRSGMITEEERQRMEIIEEKMRVREVERMEMMPKREIRHDNTISPDNTMPPRDDDMYYDDGSMPPEGGMPYDNMFPPNDMMPPDGSMPPDVRTEVDEGMYQDNTMPPRDDDMYYDDGSMPPRDDDMYYDDGSMPPEGGMPTSQSKGLLRPLLEQVEKFLASIGLFVKF